PRRGEILWDHNDWHFDLTGESFQTIDPLIRLAARPYSRLPQLNLNYQPLRLNALQLQQDLQFTRFTRKDEDRVNGADATLTGFSALYGDRLLSNTRLSYPMAWPFGFLTPAVEYRYRSCQLTNADDQLNPEVDLDRTLSAPRYSVDAGLFFERDLSLFGTGYQQTLEPRIFWVRSPYQDEQNLLANFDRAAITVTYASLFPGERFTGGDRLADLNQVSTGITTRFIRDDG